MGAQGSSAQGIAAPRGIFVDGHIPLHARGDESCSLVLFGSKRRGGKPTVAVRIGGCFQFAASLDLEKNILCRSNSIKKETKKGKESTGARQTSPKIEKNQRNSIHIQ